jgi:hypothetical protein
MMKSKGTVILVILAFLGTSCTDIIVSVSPKEEWVLKKSRNINLHYRDQAYSSSPSPDLEQVDHIIEAQKIYYYAISDSIDRFYNEDVLIYLYNDDEAEEKIGTNGGGHALPKFNTYYYTFIDSNRSITDHFGIVDPYIGAHELVHVITHRTLGYPKTKLMSEGYAVWLDGTYARYHIKDIIRHYRNDDPEKILTPHELLFNANDYTASVYYPNCGLFTGFMVHRYGIETINSIFTSSEEEFIADLLCLTDESWQELCTAYTVYINNL